MNKPIIILGAGEHARVLLEILLQQKQPVIGLTEINPQIHGQYYQNTPVLGNDDIILTYSPDEIALVNGLGSAKQPILRRKVFERFKSQYYNFAAVQHPQVTISPSAKIGEGCQILPQVVINTESHIADNVLLNTGAIVEHNCMIGNHCHIATGATLCGHCQIGNNVHIGAGATLIQQITVGNHSVIAAGAVVIADVPDNVLVAGVPAKIIKKLD